MNKLKYHYVVEAQFLGFRYHGWQTQSEHKTVQETILTILKKIYPNDNPKIRGASRTDSMVSAAHFIFSLTLDSPIIDFESFIKLSNDLLPADIKLLVIKEVDSKFNIIQSPKLKEYHYYFSHGDFKPHPFSAPLITHINRPLEIEIMNKGANLFIGTHNFRSYCYRPAANKDFCKTIIECTILKNENYIANFFPKETYYLKVTGHSFVRHQIRLMAGTLFRLGLGEISLQELDSSLKGTTDNCIGFLAPASGLILEKIIF